MVIDNRGLWESDESERACVFRGLKAWRSGGYVRWRFWHVRGETKGGGTGLKARGCTNS
jgi:hypothetical protein